MSFVRPGYYIVSRGYSLPSCSHRPRSWALSEATGSQGLLTMFSSLLKVRFSIGLCFSSTYTGFTVTLSVT